MDALGFIAVAVGALAAPSAAYLFLLGGVAGLAKFVPSHLLPQVRQELEQSGAVKKKTPLPLLKLDAMPEVYEAAPVDLTLPHLMQKKVAAVAGSLVKAQEQAVKVDDPDYQHQVNTLKLRLVQTADAWRQAVLFEGRTAELDGQFNENITLIETNLRKLTTAHRSKGANTLRTLNQYLKNEAQTEETATAGGA